MKEIITQPQKGRMAGDLVFQVLDAEGNVKREQREHNLLKDAWYKGGFFHAMGYGTRIAVNGGQALPAPFNYLHLIADDTESSGKTLLSKGTQVGYAQNGVVYSSSSTTRGTYNAVESDLDTTESILTGKCTMKYVFDFPSICANGTITKVGFSAAETFNLPTYRVNTYGTYLCEGTVTSSSRFYKVGNYLLVYKSGYVWVVYDSTGTLLYDNIKMGTHLIMSNDLTESTTTTVKSYTGGDPATYVYTLDLTTGEVSQSDTTYNMTNTSNVVQMSDGTWLCGYSNSSQPWYSFDTETMTRGEALSYSNDVGTNAYSYYMFPLDLDGARHYFLWIIGDSYSGNMKFYFIREEDLKSGKKWTVMTDKLTMTSPMLINGNVCTLHTEGYSYSKYFYGMWYPFLSTECVLSEPITKEEGETLRVIYEISYDI